MTDFALKNNYFEFNGQIKEQISGIPLLVPDLPHFSRVSLWLKLKVSMWFRYTDDIVFIWTHNEQELQTFLRSINEFHTDIKFTYELPKESIAFLDLKVSAKNSKIITDLYVKFTNRHQYLHYVSAHPNNVKQSAVSS